VELWATEIGVEIEKSGNGRIVTTTTLASATKEPDSQAVKKTLCQTVTDRLDRSDESAFQG
jgi:hypothetical protein